MRVVVRHLWRFMHIWLFWFWSSAFLVLDVQVLGWLEGPTRRCAVLYTLT